MRKALGLALVLTAALALPALAGQTQGDKRVVTDLYVTTMGTDGRPFTYYGTGYAHNPIDQIQSGD